MSDFLNKIHKDFRDIFNDIEILSEDTNNIDLLGGSNNKNLKNTFTKFEIDYNEEIEDKEDNKNKDIDNLGGFNTILNIINKFKSK